ncbi:ADP-ribosylglycohydrolase family protein [Lacisediminihabitans changchengi]|uniref:ADP-ribosylglycohydrolase family protein n=1 Tax=Lacisediminihabitans changchengi TaxID=2787634 RepID=A0A934W546_9MICO|nr:ADP-ribosylglycohydrolase family protein [Lacisediminihabitans changchengi]MBK4348949.1 ADP-ribosylglycohydrolase family protein [Lacisediminihabitans changchengi]
MTTLVQIEHALAAFTGLAIGDALGMPTQSMSRREIVEDYGDIRGFVSAGPRQRIAAGMAAGSITDDTEQAILLGELLVDGAGVIDVTVFAERLMSWEAKMAARGSLDLLGPSTKAALERLAGGSSPAESGRFGSTNGAAMRITPVGIAFDASNLSAFVDAVAATSEVTHNTSLGIASAAAIGAAVSAGVGGASVHEAIEVAIAAADEGATRGFWVAGGTIAARLRWAIPYLNETAASKRSDVLTDVIGTSVASQESVVAALALVAVAESPWDAVCLAAGLGGDTDTVAAMAGAVLGSVSGASAWPADAVEQVAAVNDLDLAPLVDRLLALRD